MTKINLNKNFWKWATFFTMSFIWGASFILIKKGLLAYSPLQSGALRMVFASTFFAPIAIKRLKLLNKNNLLVLLIVGLLGNFIPAFLFAYGETKLISTVASMLNSTTPIFTMIIAIAFFSIKVNFFNIIGLLIGFVGTLGLISKNGFLSFSGFNLGAIVILIATILYGINTNFVRNFNNGLDGLSIASLSFFLIGPLAYTSFFCSNLTDVYHSPFFWQSTISIALLAFFGSFWANIMFNIFVIKTNAILASSVTYVIPVFSLFWGILDGEKISFIHIISSIIIFFGITLVNKKEKVLSFVYAKK